MKLTGVNVGADAAQKVALVARVPLSGERWEPPGDGEIAVLREGRVIHRVGASAHDP